MKTAESVTPRHPDKMCDQISDAVLDWCLTQDPKARVAIETMGGHGWMVVMGEITMGHAFDYDEMDEMIKNKVAEVTGQNLRVYWNIDHQSTEIANGVDTGGAGDQGIMVGYACDDNDEMIPQEAYLSRKLAQFLYEIYPYDGKTQVTLDSDNQVLTIVASFQNANQSDLRRAVFDWIESEGIECTPDVAVYANPAGDWKSGGFDADTGLTGRKLMVDNYGPQVSIGGGCFSGKDATKVDRSAAYMARRIAVDILKAKGAKRVAVKLAYAIGVAQPVMATATVTNKAGPGGNTTNYKIDLLNKNEVMNVLGYSYDLTPKGIIEYLDLRRPHYQDTARWGHFGNGFQWDK